MVRCHQKNISQDKKPSEMFLENDLIQRISKDQFQQLQKAMTHRCMSIRLMVYRYLLRICQLSILWRNSNHQHSQMHFNLTQRVIRTICKNSQLFAIYLLFSRPKNLKTQRNIKAFTLLQNSFDSDNLNTGIVSRHNFIQFLPITLC